MRFVTTGCLAAVPLAMQLANASPTPYSYGDHGMMTMNGLLGRQNEDEFDVHDLSFIKRIAAVGDSYSAGIGAGDRLGTVFEALDPTSDWACSRYSMAYPVFVNEDPRLGDPSDREFQFKSCSGAVTTDILEKQIPEINNNQQIILLSAGGNDVELVNVLNQCIYQWASLQKSQGLVAEILKLANTPLFSGLDVDAITRTCEEQLEHTESLVDGSEFSQKLDSVISAAKGKLASGGKIYYTGYAKFFDIEMSRDCDSVTWSTYITKTYNMHHEEQYLTQANRRRMNSLVESVNAKLKAAVDKAGSNVEFVDYDDYVGRFEGRFCETGVDESDSEAATRPQLMFFEMNKLDPFGTDSWKRSTDSELVSTFAGHQDMFANLIAELDPDARIREENGQQSPSLRVLQANVTHDDDTVRVASIEMPKLLPDGYGRVFHPQANLHSIIANLIVFRMTNNNRRENDIRVVPEIGRMDSCPLTPPSSSYLSPKDTPKGRAVAGGVGLRILPVGDSITYGEGSDGGNGYRLPLRENLSGNQVTYVGTQSRGTMTNGNYAAWPGRTVQYIADNLGPSLDFNPNLVLIHGGTNDMDDRPGRSTEGNDPEGVIERLGNMITDIIEKLPDAVILVAMIVPTCDPYKSTNMPRYQSLIPGLAKTFRDDGEKVLAVDFTILSTSDMYDCIHPTDAGYQKMGDWWYDYIHQIPEDWIKAADSSQESFYEVESKRNRGISSSIPHPDRGDYPIQPTSRNEVQIAYIDAVFGIMDYPSLCATQPTWYPTGQIAHGVPGTNGDWKFEMDWVSEGQVADGIGKPGDEITLVDMDGDGRADYVWLDPENGVPICWLNRLREHRRGESRRWVTAGNRSNGKIGDGTSTPGHKVFLADANGDGLTDYLIFNPDNGAVSVWWNRGPQSDANNGWKWERGGHIADGARHANLVTIRFADINGDGRADYLFVGERGAVHNWMNTGKPGGTDVKWISRQGIAAGDISNITQLVFADIDGDGRDDYLIWEGTYGGLRGFLNKPSNKEGSPIWVNQGSGRSLAMGTGQDRSRTFLVDIDGDGKADYAHVKPNGAVDVWYNRGKADNHEYIDSLRFADIDGDGADDYVYLDWETGAPRVYLNKGVPAPSSMYGWSWSSLNSGRPIADGFQKAAEMRFADINGDGLADMVWVHPNTGTLMLYLNGGPLSSSNNNRHGWTWWAEGTISGTMGPGQNIRFGDVDGDGLDDLIVLSSGGRAAVWRNYWRKDGRSPGNTFERWSRGDAHGIGQRPEEIDFHDIDGDGKVDYVWTDPLTGDVKVWLNHLGEYYGDYHNTWYGSYDIFKGVGTSGANIRWAKLTKTGRSGPVVVNRETGAISAWLNGCDDYAPSEYFPPRHEQSVFHFAGNETGISNATRIANGTQVGVLHVVEFD